MSEYMTADEVGQRLRVNAGTVRAWHRTRGLPATRCGKVLRFREAELEQWLAGQQGPRPRGARATTITSVEE